MAGLEMWTSLPQAVILKYLLWDRCRVRVAGRIVSAMFCMKPQHDIFVKACEMKQTFTESELKYTLHTHKHDWVSQSCTTAKQM